jgi:hypothetical protein
MEKSIVTSRALILKAKGFGGGEKVNAGTEATNRRCLTFSPPPYNCPLRQRALVFSLTLKID